ncbi:hypothetical protein BCR35DRAFT_355276 [Leucosporidium creatinivorum]|uniref:Uncharacterized protein n=1 Tax=Leucosporidium creatinivorum TaxID=106004 RepID=A0A1Y2DL55_9BASI|nr:hypothetical protein BCR35DRAFT_355276 [Leucosporidium creatinivorum]
METSASKPPTTPVAIPSASSSSSLIARRRTPPLGRALQRTPRRRPPLFSPSSPPSQPSFTPTIAKADAPIQKDVFDLSEIGTALEELMEERSTTEEAKMEVDEDVGVSSLSLKVLGESSATAHKAPVGINDLPDELLLKIFGMLSDHYGFRVKIRGARWYNPPAAITLVCRRWLPIARDLIYRDIAIHHLGRIPLLHSALATASASSTAIRSLCITIPPTSIPKLDSPLSATSTERTLSRQSSSSSLAEADASLGGEKSSATTPQELLRLIVLHAAPHLQRLSISGVLPSSLFTAPSPFADSLAHLRLTQFATLTSLALISPCSTSPLTATAIRGALLAMSSLKELSIKGYRSRRSQKLDLDPPTKTVWGSRTRQLPLRARTMGLRRLRLEDSSLSEEDLVALVRHITPGSLIELVVEEIHHVNASEEDDADAIWTPGTEGDGEWVLDLARNPTTLHLGKVLPLVAGSLRRLQVGLWNYPAIIRSPPLPTSLAPVPSSTNNAPSFSDHHLDPLLPLLTSLESLDLGGTCCTSKLLEYLPPTVTRLSIRGCPALDAKGVSSWLKELAHRRTEWGVKIPTTTPPRPRPIPKPSTPSLGHRIFAAPQPPLRRKPFNSLSLSKPSTSSPEAGWEALSVLRWLTVSGGSTAGWSDPQESWEVQKACWVAGVVWRGPSVVGGGLGAAGGAW